MQSKMIKTTVQRIHKPVTQLSIITVSIMSKPNYMCYIFILLVEQGCLCQHEHKHSTLHYDITMDMMSLSNRRFSGPL